MTTLASAVVVATTAFFVLLMNGYESYEFDNSSCQSMIPKLQSSTNSTTVDAKSATDRMTGSSDRPDDLSPALEPSPFNITLSAKKYRRNQPMTVKIGGGEFNGIFLQVRSYKSGTQRGDSIIGTFINNPPEIATLDCRSDPHFKVANTAYSKDTKPKKNLELKWQAPPHDVGSIEFTATIIQGNRFWSVKSEALLANEFPPDVDGCGKSNSCYRYSEVTKECKTGICDYLVITKVVESDVIFTIGGKITNPSGYVGIGFTTDNKTLTFIDMCICVKTGPQQAEAAHYIVKSLSSTPEKQNVLMEDAETDVDGNFIWCKFRRPLRIPDTKAADLTQSLNQLFLWGEMDSTKAPVLPKQDQIARVMGIWNHTQTVNFNYYVGGANILKISWTILFGVLVATLLELFLM